MEDNIINWTNTLAVLNEYGAKVEQNYKDEIVQGHHIKTGNLLNTVHVHPVIGNTSIELVIDLQDYWKYLEYGTYDKKETGGYLGGSIKIAAVNIDLPANTFNVELPNMKHLKGQKGITPTHMLGNAIFETDLEFQDRIEQAVAKDLEYGINILLVKGLVF